MNLHLDSTFDRFIEKKPRRKYKPRIKTKSKSGLWMITAYSGLEARMFKDVVVPHDPENPDCPYDHGRLTNLHVWIRTCLTFYMEYREVPRPLLDENGEPILDNFGREKEVPGFPDDGWEEAHRIVKGAVWMTKETMRSAWFAMFRELRYRDENPDAFYPASMEEALQGQTGDEFIDQKTRTKGKERAPSNAHPMDTVFQRLIEDGRIIRCPHKQGRFMFNRDMCVQALMPEAWEEHRRRGEKWEGLIYDYDIVPASDLYRKKGVRNSKHISIAIPRATRIGMRHPREETWKEVLRDLDPYLLFDWEIVAAAAIQRGLLKKYKRAGAVTSHIEAWVRKGLIKRVFPGVFRSEGFWDWNSKRHVGARPNCMIHKDWFIAFAENFARMQYRTPTMTFTVGSVYEWIIEQKDSDLDRWFGSREPTKGMVSTRLNSMIASDNMGRVRQLAGRKRQLSPEMIDIFKARWTKPGEATPGEDTGMDTARRIMMMEGMPLDEAIRAVTLLENAFIIKLIIKRIDTESTNEMEKLERIQKLARRFNKTAASLIKSYKNGELDPPEGY